MIDCVVDVTIEGTDKPVVERKEDNGVLGLTEDNKAGCAHRWFPIYDETVSIQRIIGEGCAACGRRDYYLPEDAGKAPSLDKEPYEGILRG